jgi:lysophospholipase L1-like esterase
MDRVVSRHPRPRRSLAVTAAAAVAALAALVAGVVAAPTAGSGAPAFPPVRPTRVLVLGDSVMKGADARYPQALPGRDLVVDTMVNRSTGAGADVVAQRGADWDVVVVLLGHNDGGTPGAYQPAARRLLDQLRPVRRVVWLTIHEVRPYYPDVNRYIASLQGTYPNLRTADWNAVANAHPEAVSGDGLHLTPTGAGLMADLVAQQVQVAEWEFAVDLHRLATRATTTTSTTTTTVAPTTTTTTSTTTPTTDASAAPTTGPTTAPPTTTEPVEDPRTGATARDDGPGLVAVLAVPAVGAVAGATFLLRRRRRR